MNYTIAGEIRNPDTRVANQPRPGEALKFDGHVIGRDPDGSLWVALDGGEKRYPSEVRDLATVKEVIESTQKQKMVPQITGNNEDERPLTQDDFSEQYERQLDSSDPSRVPPSVQKNK